MTDLISSIVCVFIAVFCIGFCLVNIEMLIAGCQPKSVLIVYAVFAPVQAVLFLIMGCIFCK